MLPVKIFLFSLKSIFIVNEIKDNVPIRVKISAAYLGLNIKIDKQKYKKYYEIVQ